jgi:hypothetical protein
MEFPHRSLTRRTLLRGAAAACALAAAGCSTRSPLPTATGAPQLRLLGEAILPHGLQFQGTTVGGLSAIDHDPPSGTWVALSDDRSELQPARFYTLRVDVRECALAVDMLGVATLRQAGGQPFPPRNSRGEVVDPEGMRLLPGGRGVLWTSEGDGRVEQPPMLREARLDGSHIRDFETPAMFRFAQRPGSGPRNNLTFEGLALAPDARTAWVSMEAALEQTGPSRVWAARAGLAGSPRSTSPAAGLCGRSRISPTPFPGHPRCPAPRRTTA